MDYKDTLRYRNIWLGAAMLWIMLFHLPLDLGPLRYAQIVGYIGVDICFFASGAGCFCSLDKDSDAGRFMKRRLSRMMPTYVIFILFGLVYHLFTGRFEWKMALGNLLALQYFTGLGKDFNWYVSAALLFYFFAPYFKAYIDRSTPKRKWLFAAFLVLCSVPFWDAPEQIIIVSRLPIFYIGMLFAQLCQSPRKVSRKDVAAGAAAFFFGLVVLAFFLLRVQPYLWSHGLYWYPCILIVPPLCVAISYAARWLEKKKFAKPLLSFLSLCGDYSLELYLVHVLVKFSLTEWIEILNLSAIAPILWAASLVPIVFGCFALRRLTALCCRRVSKTH